MNQNVKKLIAKAKREALTQSELASLGLREFALTSQIEPIVREIEAIRKVLASHRARPGEKGTTP